MVSLNDKQLRSAHAIGLNNDVVVGPSTLGRLKDYLTGP